MIRTPLGADLSLAGQAEVKGLSGAPYRQLIRQAALQVGLGQSQAHRTAQPAPGDLPGVVRALAVDGEPG